MIKTNGEIIEHRCIAKNIFFLSLRYAQSGLTIQPGQFIQLSCPGKHSTLLKRPFSIFNASPDTVSVVYKVVGKGTTNLSEKKVGDSLEMLLPCGNPFSVPQEKGLNVLIGGGLGIAPLHFLTKYYPNTPFELWYGTSYEEEWIPANLFHRKGIDLHFHADYCNSNDSLQFSENLLQKYQRESTTSPLKIYCCGPTKLMQNVTKHCDEHHISIEVSLESRMACGFGICLGCSFQTKEGMKTVCKDGPTFDGSSVVWESLS